MKVDNWTIVCLNASRVVVWSKKDRKLAVNSGEKKIRFHRTVPAFFSVECAEFLRFLPVIFFTLIHRIPYKKLPYKGSNLSLPASQQLLAPLPHLSQTALKIVVLVKIRLFPLARQNTVVNFSIYILSSVTFYWAFENLYKCKAELKFFPSFSNVSSVINGKLFHRSLH